MQAPGNSSSLSINSLCAANVVALMTSCKVSSAQVLPRPWHAASQSVSGAASSHSLKAHGSTVGDVLGVSLGVALGVAVDVALGVLLGVALGDVPGAALGDALGAHSMFVHTGKWL